MFIPPFCPYPACLANTQSPKPKFRYTKHGYYKPKCRAHRVPRFKCDTCDRTFSRQTFRMDWRHHKPYLNASLLTLLNSGVGLRQSCRMLPLSRSCTDLKARALARHLRRLNLQLRGLLQSDAVLQFDELETFETRRRERPVTLPVIIETKSRFIIWAESAKLSPRGRMSPKREQALEEERLRLPPREDRSSIAVLRTLDRAARMIPGRASVRIQSDMKSTYPELCRRAFGVRLIQHETHSSKLKRDVANPLFPINQTEAITRDLMGRLRRQSWLVSKKRRYLDLAFQVFMAWRNYVRPRFNRDVTTTPAMHAGFLARPLKMGELVGWRADWKRVRMCMTSRYA